jgi:hypothetical protein
MEYRKKLNQIKVVLGLEVKLASEKLIDGVTIVEAENFEPGFPLFVVNEDGTKSPAPAGIHETESGLKVEVDAEGKIVKAEAKEVEAPAAEEAPEVEVEVKAAAEDVVPANETPAEEAKAQQAINEVMKKVVMAMEDLAKDVADIKTEMASMKAKYEKFSKEPGAPKAPKVTRGEFVATDADSILEAKIAALNELKNSNFFQK